MSIRVKNWDEFQHFKDRDPIWIKLYRKLLDDKAWADLEPAAAKFLVMLWLLAAEDKTHTGLLPDFATIAFRLRCSEKTVESMITKLDHWLIQDDIKPISSVTQHDDNPIALARSQETENINLEETEKSKRFALPDWVPKDLWDSWFKSKKNQSVDSKRLNLRELTKLKEAGQDPRQILETAIMRGWSGLFPLKSNAVRSVDWMMSEAATEAKARELGMWPPRPGEGWPQFRGRIQQRMEAQ